LPEKKIKMSYHFAGRHSKEQSPLCQSSGIFIGQVVLVGFMAVPLDRSASSGVVIASTG
jgi:hypothetical protein